MGLDSLSSLFLILLLSASGERECKAEASYVLDYGPRKLFVFGDSYVDTGNSRKGASSAWKHPYGITFPGKPAGRFSDGRVLTDFIAKYLGVKSPVPYRLRKVMPQDLKYGMNFAFGGTGVLDTAVVDPNMTTQIDFLQQLIKDKVYTTSDLNNSVALVSVAGNDYGHYLNTNGSDEGIPSFIVSVVNQMTSDVKRIHRLGVKKIGVNNLEPLGCLPVNAAPFSFQECNSSMNTLMALHNILLYQAVIKLNQETQDKSTFLVLDVYDSFMSILNHPSNHNIQNQFKPCCVGVSSEYSCGSIDNNKVKKYTVCDNPETAFFWDWVHPTEAGWHAIYNQLQTTIAFRQLHYQQDGAEARQLLSFRATKLFVFGDSYVDTGNTMKVGSSAWKDPYGESFPGKPAGRFSDGRVLTDYIAKYLRVKSPVPYQLRESIAEHVKYGMNFAFGGTGVFNTSSTNPNMTIQLDFFQQLIKNKVYNENDLSDSVALVSVAGNDYSYYLQTNGSIQGFPSFITSVVNQTTRNLIRIYEVGMKKIVVSGLQPLGCLPQNTFTSSFQQCNSTFNTLVDIHNSLLSQAVAKLNQQTKDNSTFIVLDLYDSFMSVLNDTSSHKLKPCCAGVSSEFSCGSVDDNNVKKYNVCDVPKSAFFWDLLHPTQAGWHAVYNKLRKTTALQQLH